MASADRENLKSFDPYADRNGRGLSDAPTDKPRYAGDVHAKFEREPMGESEAAFLASGLPRKDADVATEAETPPENIAHISDPSLPKRPTTGAPGEAIERATAGFGKK